MEWYGAYSGGETSTTYLATALQETVNYNLSMIGSTTTPVTGTERQRLRDWLRVSCTAAIGTRPVHQSQATTSR